MRFHRQLTLFSLHAQGLARGPGCRGVERKVNLVRKNTYPEVTGTTGSDRTGAHMDWK